MPGSALESITTTSQSSPHKRLVSRAHNPPPNAKSDPFSAADPPTAVRPPDRKTIETNFQAASVSPNPRVSDGNSQTSATASNATTTLLHDVHAHVPIDLQTSVTVTKVSAKKDRKVTIRLDVDLGQIFYLSQRAKISKSLRLLCTL